MPFELDHALINKLFFFRGKHFHTEDCKSPTMVEFLIMRYSHLASLEPD